MRPDRIAIVSRQIGTAEAFSPLIECLKKQLSEEKVKVFAYPESMDTLKGFSPFLVNSFQEAEKSLVQFKPDLVVTGTSAKVSDDLLYWDWAQQTNTESVAYIDQWVNLKERFFSNGKLHSSDKVAVVDENIKKNISEFGIDNKNIFVVGNPLLENKKIRKFEKKSTYSACFVTEPIVTEVGDENFKKKHGYLDVDSFQMAVDSLSQFATNSNTEWNLLVKIHPRDQKDRFEKIITSLQPSIQIKITDFSKEDIFASVDLVMGMTSMFLLESSQMGIPTVSFQPQRKLISEVIESQNSIGVVTEKGSGSEVIKTAIENFKNGKTFSQFDKGSFTQNFLNMMGLS
jgi:hypothetical protein